MSTVQSIDSHDARKGPDRDLEALAKQQGVRPLQEIEQLRDSFWPEDENVEAFLATIRDWRRENGRPLDR